MTISIQIPEAIEAQLQRACGDINRLAKESLAMEAYKREMLSIGQVAELLGLSVYDAEGMMKTHGVASRITIADIEQDRSTIHQVFGL